MWRDQDNERASERVRGRKKRNKIYSHIELCTLTPAKFDKFTYTHLLVELMEFSNRKKWERDDDDDGDGKRKTPMQMGNSNDNNKNLLTHT